MNKKGFTVLELLFAALIGGGLVYMVGGFVSNLMEAQTRMDRAQIALSEEAIGNRQVFMDMRTAGISFNLLNLPSDPSDPADPAVEGGTGNFFDFLPDHNCTANCKRLYILSKDDPAKSFIVAISEGGLAEPTPLNPVRFYDSTPAPNLNTPGTLAFNFTKLRNVLNQPPGGVTLLEPGRLLLFYSPITMRARGVSGYDMEEPPGYVSLLTRVVSAGANALPTLSVVTDAGWMPTQNHPAMPQVNIAQGWRSYSAFDTFFRTMPPVGGEKAFGMVMPVMVVRFRVEPITIKGKPSGQLIRERYEDGSWLRKTVLARDVKKVKFTRRNISIPSIGTVIESDLAKGR